MKIGPKDPQEVKLVVFDFTNQLGTHTVASATVTVEVARGTDQGVSAMASGTPQTTGAYVRQLVGGGVLGTSYQLHCLATDSSGQVHKITADLDVLRV